MKQFFIFISLFALISCKKDGVTTPAVKTTSINIDKNNNVATVNGEVTAEGASAVTKRGFVWSTVVNPTVSDASSSNQFGPGVFTQQISGLNLGATYYVRAYATNANGTAYGNQLEFKTLTAGKFSGISYDSLFFTSVKINVNIESLGDIAIKSIGICYSKSGTPSFKNDSTTILHSNNSDKSFSIGIKNLTFNTKYFVRAFINTNLGIFYSNETDFTTKQYTPGTFGDIVITSLSNTGADAKVNISSLGDAPIKSMGLCVSTTIDPVFKADSSTLIHSNINDQIFTLVLKNIKENTKYFIRAFINSDAGIVYSKSFFFTTLGRPTLADLNPNGSITRTTATLDSYVISDNGGQVSENGFVFGDKKIIIPVNGSLKINHELTSLIGNTNYSVYAFATNKYGTGVSKTYNFLTGPTEPVVTTGPITDIFSSNARSTVLINSNGGSEITDFGICISSKENPTILDRFYTTSNINNKILLSKLTYDSTYYVRAYAKNKVGISYGKQVSFTTEYQVGETGPAGGLIIHDKGSKLNGWRYVEVSLKDVSDTVYIVRGVNFSCLAKLVTGLDYGDGFENSISLKGSCDDNGTYSASRKTSEFTLNGFNDWYIPSQKEMLAICKLDLTTTTMKNNDVYHSSSIGVDSDTKNLFYYGYARNGNNYTEIKWYSPVFGRVKPVRRFK